MPAKSKVQQRYFGAALARKRAGKARTGDPDLPEKELKKMASGSTRGKPTHVRRAHSA